jgi:4-hydroxymandelate oxidase
MSDRQLLNLVDYETRARQLLDPSLWDYIAGGSDDEISLRADREAFARIRLRPRILVGHASSDTATTVLGTPVASPILVAPVAYQGLVDPEGECATARGATKARSIFVASTMASRSLEDIASSACERWLQLYVFRDRAITEGLLRRAESTGCRAIVVTGDVPRLGRRERDLRNGFALPAHVDAVNVRGSQSHHLGTPTAGSSAIEVHAQAAFEPALTWDILAWVRARVSLPIVVKGILTAEDARLAVDHGASAIIVSNHGGRQLDGTISPIDALPECVDAVGGRCEIYVDGGVRRGTDVLKALALGARAVFVGRPILWGLAIAGEAGVSAVLALLADELERAMCLAGIPDVRSIPASILSRPQ